MAKMRFSAVFDRPTGPTTAIHFAAGGIYEVPDELVQAVLDAGVATHIDREDAAERSSAADEVHG